MKLFSCIVDDGENVFRSLVAAKSKKQLLEVYGGNGSFEKIEDWTNRYFNETSVDRLRESLRMTGWGEGETELLCGMLAEHVKNKK